MDSTTGQRICVLRFSSIGDIVLTTSPLKTLQARYPNTKIDYVTLTQFAPLLEHHPYIDQLITVLRSAKAGELRALGRYLDQQQYTFILDLHNTLRAKLIRSAIKRTPVRVFRKPRVNRWLLFQFHWNRFPPYTSYRAQMHEPLMDLVNDGDNLPQTCLVVTDQERDSTPRHFNGNRAEKPLLAIVPGAAWPQKQWSVEYYRQLIATLRFDWNIVILGGKGDKITKQLKDIDDPAVIHLAGKTSLRESMAILSQVRVALGSDTGFMHVAEAVGTPAVMILGPTSRETGAGTNLQKSVTVERSDIWCRPCSQNGKRPCIRSSQVCLNTITPVDIDYHLRRYQT